MPPTLDSGTLKFLEQTCIFCQPWWLEAVSPGQWDVAVARRGDEVVGVLPYTYKMRLGRYLLIEMPPLTPYLGPWLKSSSEKESDRLSEEKEVLTSLIQKLPRFASFNQRFHPTITNWLPFYWSAFQQTTQYTYVINDLSDPEKVFSDFSYAKRKNIKRSKDMLEVRQDLPCGDFYHNHALTLSQQGKRISYSFELFERIYHECYARNNGKVFYALDEKNNMHSAIFVIWDEKSAYYLLSTIDPEFRNSGSASLLITEAMKYCSGKTGQFDFEGSMIEGVERSFRELGGHQVPCFQVFKMNSSVVETYRKVWKWTHRRRGQSD